MWTNHAAEGKLDQAESKPTQAKKLARVARTLVRHKGISAACRQSVGDALTPTLGAIDGGRF